MGSSRKGMDYMLGQGEIMDVARAYAKHYIAESKASVVEENELQIITAPDGAGVCFISPDLELVGDDGRAPLQTSLMERILDCAALYLTMGYAPPEELRLALPVNHHNLHWTGTIATISTFGDLVREAGAAGVAAPGYLAETRRRLARQLGIEAEEVNEAVRARQLFSHVPVTLRHFDSLNSYGNRHAYFERVQAGFGELGERLQRVPCSYQRGNSCGDHTAINLFSVSMMGGAPPQLNTEGAPSSAELRALSLMIPRTAKSVRVDIEDIVTQHDRRHRLSEAEADAWAMFQFQGFDEGDKDVLTVIDEAIQLFQGLGRGFQDVVKDIQALRMEEVEKKKLSANVSPLTEAILSGQPERRDLQEEKASQMARKPESSSMFRLFKPLARRFDSAVRELKERREEKREKEKSPELAHSRSETIVSRSSARDEGRKKKEEKIPAVVRESSPTPEAMERLNEYTGKVVNLISELEAITGKEMPALIELVIRHDSGSRFVSDREAIKAYVEKHPNDAMSVDRMQAVLAELARLMSGEDELTNKLTPENKIVFSSAAMVYVYDICAEINKLHATSVPEKAVEKSTAFDMTPGRWALTGGVLLGAAALFPVTLVVTAPLGLAALAYAAVGTLAGGKPAAPKRDSKMAEVLPHSSPDSTTDMARQMESRPAGSRKETGLHHRNIKKAEKESPAISQGDAINAYVNKVVDVISALQEVTGDRMPALIESVIQPSSAARDEFEVNHEALKTFVRQQRDSVVTVDRLSAFCEDLARLLSGDHALAQRMDPAHKIEAATMAMNHVHEACEEIIRQQSHVPRRSR